MTPAPRTAELVTTQPNQNIALRGVNVHARIAALAARVDVRQTYVNLETVPIEAVYTFPLPDGAAVCGFEVVTGDRVLTGAIDEADKARERFDDAIDAGHGAYLLDANRPDVFTVRVGNLKPRQACTIRIGYVVALSKVDRQIRLSLPTTIAPRYATTSGTDPIDAALSADDLNPPHLFDVPYGLTLRRHRPSWPRH
ncbi:MAG: VIT domain-containing protein [Tepidisphaeraceae bacterium]